MVRPPTAFLVLLGVAASQPGLAAQQPVGARALGPAGSASSPAAARGNPAAADSLAGRATAILDEPAIWRVPIHTRRGTPECGDYGWWAAQRTYKASFHDGFVFYPMLGPGHEKPLPLRWTTRQVSAGGQPIGDLREPRQSPAHWHTDWRYEYRHGAVTEAYDVREDGVEQTFVVHERPQVAGDLVIRGTIDSELLCDDVAPAHQRLVFRDAKGNPIVHYGAAFAVDARGNRTEVTTGYERGEVRLTVPAGWLASAAYPVVVDPLTSLVEVAIGGIRIGSLDVAHDAESQEIMIVFTYDAGGNYDAKAVLVRNDFLGSVLVFSDLTAAHTTHGVCCFVGGADKWMIATLDAANAWRIGLYTHQRANYGLNTGHARALLKPIGDILDLSPSIGGSFHVSVGAKAMLTWERYVGQGTNPLVWGTVVDPFSTQNVPLSAQLTLDPATRIAQRNPRVNKCSSQGDWIVVYQEYDDNIPNDDWDIDAVVVNASATIVGRFRLGDDIDSDHKILPMIEGHTGRYFYSCTRKPVDVKNTSDFGTSISVEGFDWTGSFARRTGLKEIARDFQRLTTNTSGHGIAYDRRTSSHAAIVYLQDVSSAVNNLHLVRVGIQAEPVERVTMTTSSRVASLVYNPDASAFIATAGTRNVPWRAYASYFTLQSAQCSAYGTGCGGAISCANGALPPTLAGPHRGSVDFQLQLNNAAPNAPCVPVLGFRSASYALPGSCRLLLDPTLPLIALPPTITSSSGSASIRLPIPESWSGSLYAQWATVQTVLRTSDAVQMTIR